MKFRVGFVGETRTKYPFIIIIYFLFYFIIFLFLFLFYLFLFLFYFILFYFLPVVRAVRILPTYSLWIVEGNIKGQARELGSPSSVFFCTKRQGAEGKGRVKSP